MARPPKTGSDNITAVPRIIASAVKTIDRILSPPDSIKASVIEEPRCWCSKIKSMSSSEFRTTIPAKAISLNLKFPSEDLRGGVTKTS